MRHCEFLYHVLLHLFGEGRRPDGHVALQHFEAGVIELHLTHDLGGHVDADKEHSSGLESGLESRCVLLEVLLYPPSFARVEPPRLRGALPPASGACRTS